jgi:hypothetical protein
MPSFLDPAVGRRGRGLGRAAGTPGRRLLRAVEEALAAGSAEALVVAHVVGHGRSLEIVCTGPLDVVGPLAPVAGACGAELIVRYAAEGDPLVDAVLRDGGVIVAGRRERASETGFAHAPA